MHKRRQLGNWLNRLGLTGLGAEIGVGEGENAREILDNWHGKTLFLVDAWTPQSPEAYVDVANVSLAAHAAHLASAVERLKPHGDRAKFLRMASEDAAGRFEDGSLDFVYIDANHAYERVRRDLEMWLPKVRQGGLLAGHDYLDGHRHGSLFGVQQAVDELAAANKFDISITNEEWPTWSCVNSRANVEKPLPRPENLRLLTAHNAAHQCLADVTLPGKRDYCATHGYAFTAATDGFDPARPPAWSKIRFIQQFLSQSEWVFWSDADSVITNEAIPLESFLDPAYDIIVTREDVGVGTPVVNTGNFFIRRTPWSFEFLERLYAQTQLITHPWWENAAFLHLLETEDLSEHVKIVPQRRFNSYPANHRADDFILHLAGLSNEVRLNVLANRNRSRNSGGAR